MWDKTRLLLHRCPSLAHTQSFPFSWYPKNRSGTLSHRLQEASFPLDALAPALSPPHLHPSCLLPDPAEDDSACSSRNGGYLPFRTHCSKPGVCSHQHIPCLLGRASSVSPSCSPVRERKPVFTHPHHPGSWTASSEVPVRSPSNPREAVLPHEQPLHL